MGKVLYSATMSLDGYIAGTGGDMSWLSEYLGGDDPLVGELIEGIGALLIGSRTYHGDDPNRGTPNEGPFGGAWHGPQWVLTHHAPDHPVPDMTFTDDLATAVAESTAAAGDRYVNVLGADVGRQCLEAGLLDEILVFVAPVLLGDGVPLFRHPGGTKVRLEPYRRDAGTTPHLWYRVVR
jgi:dihydrofolate reductase